MRHGMNPRFPRQPWIWIWWRGVFVAGTAVALLAGLYCCDKGTGPKPNPKYLLYAAMDAPQDEATGFIAVIDCETDSIIDSVKNVSSNPGIVASPDGKYFAALSGGSPPLIFDASSRTRIGSLAARGFGPLFLPDAAIAVCPDNDSAIVYGIPDFTVKEVWPRPRFKLERGPGPGRLSSVERRGADLFDKSKLVMYDYRTGLAVDSVIIDPDAGDVGFQLYQFSFSPDATRLYAVGGQRGIGSEVVGYDLKAHRTLFIQRLYGPFGNCRVTPNGKELWVTDPGLETDEFPSWPQIIFVFDALGGGLLDSVSIRGISPNPARPLAAQDIRFVPDGSKAYVNCGSFAKGLQPILVINTRTRHVDRLIFGGFQDLARWIDIAPRP
jgi:DNA-binding beta-propeller fold protein YncE